jgi:hypothetical protein
MDSQWSVLELLNNLERDFPQMKLLHRYSSWCMQVLRHLLASVICD